MVSLTIGDVAMLLAAMKGRLRICSVSRWRGGISDEVAILIWKLARMTGRILYAFYHVNAPLIGFNVRPDECNDIYGGGRRPI